METIEAIEKFIDTNRIVLITGDFNICLRKNPRNALTLALKNKGFSQLQVEATHIMGGHIDHVYWYDARNEWNEPQLERQSVYYSDHDAILIMLSKRPQKRSKLSRRKK